MATESPAAVGWQLEQDSAEAYEQYLATAFRPWAASLLAHGNVAPGDRVLDVGCGTGIVAREAAAVVGTDGRVVGVDLNEGMLRVARARSTAARLAIEWRQSDAASLPFDAGTFDVVVSEQAAQFFPDPVAAFSEMRRVLAPGGRAAVSVCRPIAHSPVYGVMADALARHVSADAGAMMRSPFAPWSVDELRALFMKAGFTRVRVEVIATSLRYPSVAEFLRREAASSPLAGPIGALPANVRDGLIRDLERSLADHVDDAGVVCPLEMYVVLASCSL